MLFNLGTAHQSFAQEGTSKTKKGWFQKRGDGRRGDKPNVNRRKQREIRARNNKRKGEKAYKGDITGRRIKTKQTQRPTTANRAKPISPYAGKRKRTESTAAKEASRRFQSRPITATRSGERAFKGSISGGKIRTKNSSSARKTVPKKRAVTPYKYRQTRTEQDAAKRASKQKVNRPITSSPKGERAGRVAGGGRGRIRTATATKSPTGGGVNRSIFGSRQRGVASSTYAGRKRLSASQRAKRASKGFSAPRSISGGIGKGGAGKRINPRSGSGAFLFGKKKDPYRTRKMKAWEEAHQGDITGRKVRTKTSPLAPSPRKTKFNPYFGRKRKGDQKYAGNVRPNRFSISKSSESRPGDRSTMQGGSISRSSESKPGQRQSARGRSISGQFKGAKKPGFNAYYGRRKKGDSPYAGRISPRSNSITRASESKPGKRVSANGRSISGQFKGAKKPGFNAYYGRKRRGDVAYSGNVRARNNSISKPGEQAGKRNRYTGGKFLSITPKMGGPRDRLPKQALSDSGKKSSAFSGNARARKPLKGGGSVARNNWNNKGQATTDRVRSKTSEQVSVFSGNLKARKPLKGGGSVARNNWNNRGQATTDRVRSKTSEQVSVYSGNLKAKKPLKGGGTVARNNWNNKGQATTDRVRSKTSERISVYAGTMKAKKPLKGGGSVARNNWNNKAQPLEQKKQSPQIYYATRFKGDKKKKEIAPEQNDDYKNYSGRFKTKNLKPELDDSYVNYSGSIKVVRRKGKGYHPSFYFHREDSHSLAEKEKKFSFKMLWSKLFRTNQPSNLRKKPGKLEFDEREQGLWYE